MRLVNKIADWIKNIYVFESLASKSNAYSLNSLLSSWANYPSRIFFVPYLQNAVLWRSSFVGQVAQKLWKEIKNFGKKNGNSFAKMGKSFLLGGSSEDIYKHDDNDARNWVCQGLTHHWRGSVKKIMMMLMVKEIQFFLGLSHPWEEAQWRK